MTLPIHLYRVSFDVNSKVGTALPPDQQHMEGRIHVGIGADSGVEDHFITLRIAEGGPSVFEVGIPHHSETGARYEGPWKMSAFNAILRERLGLLLSLEDNGGALVVSAGTTLNFGPETVVHMEVGEPNKSAW